VKYTQEDAEAAFTKEVGLKTHWVAESLPTRFALMKVFSVQGQWKRREHDNPTYQKIWIETVTFAFLWTRSTDRVSLSSITVLDTPSDTTSTFLG
jgi:hypothetical protein